MKHLLKTSAILVAILSIAIACGGNEEDTPAPTPTPTPTDPNCITESITYNSHIKAIVNANCATSGCHVSGTGRANFTSYATLKAYADNGQIKQKVLVSKTMPPNGSLSTCQLNQIEAWLNAGAPEN